MHTIDLIMAVYGEQTLVTYERGTAEHKSVQLGLNRHLPHGFLKGEWTMEINERSMRTLSDQEMINLMRRSDKTAFESWRDVLAVVDENEVTEKEKKRVEKAVKRAEKALKQNGIEIPVRAAREDVILQAFPYVENSIYNSTMELAYYYMDKKDWDTFSKIILTNNYAKTITFDYLFNVIPDDRKYDLTVNAYKWGGANIKGVQEAIVKLPIYGKPDLPEDFEGEMTIFRGCIGDAGKAASSFSWTINLEVAKYFRRAQEAFFGSPAHIYRGRIRREDIAAYIPDLGQAEIVQIGKVTNVEDITDQVIDASLTKGSR